jgi:hypothetical protein
MAFGNSMNPSTLPISNPENLAHQTFQDTIKFFFFALKEAKSDPLNFFSQLFLLLFR